METLNKNLTSLQVKITRSTALNHVLERYADLSVTHKENKLNLHSLVYRRREIGKYFLQYHPCSD